MEQRFDVAVIGGGPAGLIGALDLARLRRRVILFDGGRPRAAMIPVSHNYPGALEGMPGTRLLGTLREQLGRYAVETVHAAVERLDTREDGDVEVRWSGGALAVPAVLLATGAADIEPEMPHLAEARRSGHLRYCPVCDGYEVIDQRVGVIVADDAGLGEVSYLRQFTASLTVLLVHGHRISEAARRSLRETGTPCFDTVTQAIRAEGAEVIVPHAGGEFRCDSLYCALGMRVHSGLATALGATADAAGYLEIDPHHRTGIPGLYAAGDVAQGLNQITVAFGGAAIAASAIHLDLRARGR
ncbi:NAD(P)/FAD-dependent oxidoreductase [Chitinasiproducens palmae]|uniref:Thioredoxin reductase (NADPH) n=1 Tax=Chitinasiproducens palmae TaxID=1770053 RepID=A0A1H2PW81_9BURK|nr:NAD(P)/FAD-dependent oxidoreductase [Chitinasiproducens palmae]SDV51172.1 thioredoxin reductase (NADPH) [Chitinasiproducens palmae]